MRFAFFACAFAAALAAGAAPAFGVSDLMAMLAKVDRSTVAFEETRRFAVLSTPVVRRGTLRYERPDRLEMQVVTPFPETTQIVGDRVRVESPDGRREWSLAAQPVALAWIDAIRASLAGDASTLGRAFRITVSGSAASWQLHLEPIDTRVAATLAAVDVRGRQAELATIEIADRQGDRIVIELRPTERRSR